MASQKRRGTNQSPSEQPTIHQHWHNSACKCSPLDNKRRKLDSPSPIPSTTSQATTVNMYNFGTTRSGTVDLTDSKASSPKNRRISNAGLLSTQSPQNEFGPKRLVVKGLKPVTRSKPNEYITTTLSQIDAALTALFKDERPTRSNEELYKGAENVCKLGSASDLDKLTDKRCKEHIRGTVRPSLVRMAGEPDVDVLRAVVAAWKVWHRQTVSSADVRHCFPPVLICKTDQHSFDPLLSRPDVPTSKLKDLHNRIKRQDFQVCNLWRIPNRRQNDRWSMCSCPR